MNQALTPVTFDKAQKALKNFNTGLVTPFAQGTSQLTLPSNGVTVVAAKTGEGKTSLMLNLLLHGLLENADKHFYFVSYEEPDYHLLLKLLMILSGKSLDKHDNFAAFVKHFCTNGFKAEKAENEEFREPLVLMNKWLEEGRLHLCRTEMPCDLIAAELRKKAQDQSVGGIFVDYIQRVRVPESAERKERYLQLKSVSEHLLALAENVNAPVVVGAQRRQQYQTESPLIDSIRESSDISHDASLVLVLVKASKGSSFQKKYKLHVPKNRFGRSDYHLDLHFDGPSYCFSNLNDTCSNAPSAEASAVPNVGDEDSTEWDVPDNGAKKRRSRSTKV